MVEVVQNGPQFLGSLVPVESAPIFLRHCPTLGSLCQELTSVPGSEFGSRNGYRRAPDDSRSSRTSQERLDSRDGALRAVDTMCYVCTAQQRVPSERSSVPEEAQ